MKYINAMSSETFYSSELKCQQSFDTLKQLFNVCTPENHPIIFQTKNDYAQGMGIVGICSKLYPEIRIITFELMSNHIHLVVSGEEEYIQEFFQCFKKRYAKYQVINNREPLGNDFFLKTFKVDNLEYARNAISYVNRNAYVVREDNTPLSYPWGANLCYFQPLIKLCYDEMKNPVTIRGLRNLYNGKGADSIKELYTFGGVASPFSFCSYNLGESLFRNAKHYFYKISKSVETYEEIAKIIGESHYFTDDDLFLAARGIAKKEFGNENLPLLSLDSKISLAKELHFRYNANNKQICRMLKIQDDFLRSIF